ASECRLRVRRSGSPLRGRDRPAGLLSQTRRLRARRRREQVMFIYLNTPIVDDLVRVKYSRSEKVSRLIEHLLASGQRRSRNCSMDKPASLRIPAKSDFLMVFPA